MGPDPLQAGLCVIRSVGTPTFTNDVLQAPVDTDKDGIPDAYETAHGTNPNVNDSANIASNGYASASIYAFRVQRSLTV